MAVRKANPETSTRFGGFECDHAEADERYSFSGRVFEQLEEFGLSVRKRPQLVEDHASIFPGMHSGDYFDGRLPMVIRKLNLDQLSALYSLFSNWYAYVVSQTRLIAARRAEAKKKKEFAWSMVRSIYKKDPDTGKNRTDQVTSDYARGDFRFVEADALYEEYNALYNCLEAAVTVAEADMKVISREVTLHQMKEEQGFKRQGVYGRAANVPSRPEAPPQRGPKLYKNRT